MAKIKATQFILANRLGQPVKSSFLDYVPKAANTTQQDQSFTLQELMEGFVVGRIPNVARNVDYDFDPEVVDGKQISMMSLSEAEAYANMVSDKLSTSKQRYHELLAQVERQKKLQAQDLADLKAKANAAAAAPSTT